MIKKCLMCDRDFDASRKDVLCCSKSCRNQYNNQRIKRFYAKRKKKPHCTVCGCEITNAANGNVKFCRDCVVITLAKRMKEKKYMTGSDWNLMHRHGVSREEVQKKLYEVMKNDR